MDSKIFKRYPILINILIIAVTAVVLIILALKFLDLWTHHGSTSTVPSVKGMSFEAASNILKDADLDIVISDSIYDDKLPGGTVVEVWPKAGAVVKAGREVYLTIVAYSPRTVVIDMPLTDISLKQAENYLYSHGITAINVQYVPGEFTGSVVAARIGNEYVTIGSRIPANATVTLEVSRGPEAEEVDSLSIGDVIDSVSDSIFNSDYPEGNENGD